MNVFITGITGTLGSALAKYHHDKGDMVYGCARNESIVSRHREQHPWGRRITCGDAITIEPMLGSINLSGVRISRIYHCSAMKHVEHCESSPSEATYQNLEVTEQIIETASRLETDLVFVSSDKACMPSNVYGATKLIGERMVTKAGFKVVRLGNLIGSAGSVFEKWKAAVDRGEPIKITDPDMTRFFIPVREAVRYSVEHSFPGKVIVPRMKGMLIGDFQKIYGKAEIIGRRPGERTDENLIAPGELCSSAGDYYVLGTGYYLSLPNSRDADRWRLGDFAEELRALDLL